MDTKPTTTNTATSVDDVVATLVVKRDALALRRTHAEQEVRVCNPQIGALTRRISAIQDATAVLAGLPSLAPEQEWLDHLTAWRQTLRDELSLRIGDPQTPGLQQNLTLSISAIDVGLGAVDGTGYHLTTLRLGALMRDAGYEPVGANPNTHYSGEMPWFGSLPEVERRIASIRKQRVDAQAQLDEALLDDAARAKRDAELKARRDALKTAPQRKVRGDGSEYDRYPDGRVVEVTN